MIAERIRRNVVYSDQLVSSAIQCLEDVGSTTSILDKQYILSSNINNEALQDILVMTYDPYLVYYLKKVDVSCFQATGTLRYSSGLSVFKDLLVDLAERNITGLEAYSKACEVLLQLPPSLCDLCLRVIKKDLNIGIKSKTINSVWVGMIPEFGVQLAKEFDGRMSGPIIIEPKLDGYRALGSTTTGQLFSRNGKLIEGYDHIESALRNLPAGYMVDGEIMSSDFKGTQQNAFAKTSGKQGILTVFDFFDEKDPQRYTQKVRRENLVDVYNDYEKYIHGSISLIQSAYIDNSDQRALQSFYDQAISMGFEGVMIKDPEATYDFKRSRNWQKMKPVKSIDLRVIGLEPGEPGSKYEHTLGRLVCDYYGNEVRVGSGISDEQRNLWWTNPTLISMKTIEIMYQEESENEKGGRSLRFPRFKRLRPDKD